MTRSSRRIFLGQLAAGTLLSEALGRAADHRIERLGLQLYTVRTEMAKDFEGTLAKVAAAGYQEVEFAGYFDRTPKDVRAILDRHRLRAPSAHVDYPSLGEKFPQVIEASRIIGHKYIVNPWIDEEMRKQPDIWPKAAETFNRAGEMCRKAGIQFAYHNHHFEFVPVPSARANEGSLRTGNGRRPFDLLLESCDPKLVKMELDLFWITVAGQDPLAYFRKYPGRFPLVHVKGLGKLLPAADTTPIPFDQVFPNLTDVGSADVVDWKRIFAQSEHAGIKHYFVEHDQPKSPFDSIRASAEYLKALRF